jgi:hypothetical protein
MPNSAVVKTFYDSGKVSVPAVLSEKKALYIYDKLNSMVVDLNVAANNIFVFKFSYHKINGK